RVAVAQRHDQLLFRARPGKHDGFGKDADSVGRRGAVLGLCPGDSDRCAEQTGEAAKSSAKQKRGGARGGHGGPQRGRRRGGGVRRAGRKLWQALTTSLPSGLENTTVVTARPAGTACGRHLLRAGQRLSYNAWVLISRRFCRGSPCRRSIHEDRTLPSPSFAP